MNNKKNGFTLIELLAVILILGIIALIAIPTVNTVIEDSKKGSLKASASSILKTAEENCQLQRIKGEAITKKFTIADNQISSDMNIKNLPDSGTITLDDECNASVAIVDNGYCATIKNDVSTINNNIYHCGDNYVDIPKTQEACFIFDEASKTITGYDYLNGSCPKDVSIPATINDVPVEHIADKAFYNATPDYWIASGTNIPEEESYTKERYTLYDLRENLLKNNFNIEAIIPIDIHSDSMVKYCYDVNGDEYEAPLNYLLSDSDKYIDCNIYLDDFTYGTDYTYKKSNSSLTGVDFSKALNLISIGNDAFYGNMIERVNFENLSNLTNIGISAFSRNHISNTIDMSGLVNLKTLSADIFSDNMIPNVILPPNIETIDQYAFYGNDLQNINLSKNIKKIHQGAFGDNNIVRISIPSSVEFLSGFDRNNITSIDIPSNVQMIGVDAFYDNSISKLLIPSNVKILEGYAFSDNSITSLTLSEGLEYISFDAFSSDSNINNIGTLIIPKSVTNIDDYAFYYAGVTSITLNEGLKEIGYSSFAGNSIENLTLPSTLEKIGVGAFRYCDIKKVYLNDNLKTIDSFAFFGNSISSINLPKNIQNVLNGAFTKNNFPDGSRFMPLIKDGVKYSNILASYAGPKNQNITFSDTDSYTTIMTGAFVYTNFKSIMLPSTIKTIEPYAFQDVWNNSVTFDIPSSVTNIGEGAFECSCSDNTCCNYIINIHKSINSISGAPWGDNIYAKINWLG